MQIQLFLRKTLGFLGIPLAGYLVLLTVLSQQLNKKTIFPKKWEVFKKESLFLGDSHIEKAINDSILNSCYNVGQNSESLYFSYFKLKKILETTPGIRNVFLGFSYHSLSDYYNKFIDGEYSNAVSGRYFYLLSPAEKFRILCANKKDMISYCKVITENGFLDFTAGLEPYLGGYTNQYTNTSAQKQFMDKRILFQYYTRNELNSFAEINIQYLKKIQELCRHLNVHLTLVNTPMHKYYKSKVPVRFIEKYNEVVHDLNLSVLDLSEMPLNDVCFVPDGDHVSQMGATLTTQYIASQLTKEIAQKR